MLYPQRKQQQMFFSFCQFVFEGYHRPYLLDISSKGGGILVYVKYPIPSRRLSCENFYNSIQPVSSEINLTKEKWLVISNYNPPSQNCGNFLNNLTKMIDFFTDAYENFLIMGNFITEPSDPSLKAFLNSNNLYN